MTPAKSSRQQQKMSKSEVIASFVACPRCSYFLTGYRLISDDFDSAVDESAAGWLSLSWDHEIHLLVQKSYGSHIDMELDTFQGICPECQRPYSYKSLDPEVDKSTFKVKIVP
ncbi:MAG: hypothetical protein BMS9Abin02_1004 [Anaerolineae bacterium]|nr:MAG: hypothetical protein BMS9Abin02_1004 [Anaerolineae bacterium]